MKKILLLPLLLLLMLVVKGQEKTTLGISLCDKTIVQDENSNSTITTTLAKLIECPEITFNKEKSCKITSFQLAKRSSDKGYSVIKSVNGNKISKDILDMLKKEQQLETIEIQDCTIKDEKGNIRKLNGRKDALIIFITE
jgi:hypothetical protein